MSFAYRRITSTPSVDQVWVIWELEADCFRQCFLFSPVHSRKPLIAQQEAYAGRNSEERGVEESLPHLVSLLRENRCSSASVCLSRRKFLRQNNAFNRFENNCTQMQQKQTALSVLHQSCIAYIFKKALGSLSIFIKVNQGIRDHIHTARAPFRTNVFVYLVRIISSSTRYQQTKAAVWYNRATLHQVVYPYNKLKLLSPACPWL